MATKNYKPNTPGFRGRQVVDYSELSKVAPEKSLLVPLSQSGGRNNQGRISVRFRGGGRKRMYRVIDFKRNLKDVSGTVKTLEYDPNRSSHIALVVYDNGQKRYILASSGLKVGQRIMAGSQADIKEGNTLQIKDIPAGTLIHNVELSREKGGQVGRSAGCACTLQAKNEDYATVKLPSGEVRLISVFCSATIGTVGNSDHRNTRKGKAGASRWKGRRPHVRGSVMNPCDHPHGGGEGKAPIGLAGPVTPWGQPTLGYKTRKKKNPSNKFIVKRRK